MIQSFQHARVLYNGPLRPAEDSEIEPRRPRKSLAARVALIFGVDFSDAMEITHRVAVDIGEKTVDFSEKSCV
jgi:hypothetical protein